MNSKFLKNGIFALLLILASNAAAQEYQPLGILGNAKDWSGLHWNMDTEELWAVQDEGQVRSFLLTNDDFVPGVEFMAPGDLEGVTQVPGLNDLFLLEERRNEVIQVDHEGTILHAWSLDECIPLSGKKGPEGIVFLPNSEALQASNLFSLIASSDDLIESDFGGIFLIAKQDDPNLYAVLLERSRAPRLLSRVITNNEDPRGLAFHEETGLIYVLGRELSILDLDGQTRSTLPMAQKNLEGIAVVSGYPDLDVQSLFILNDEPENSPLGAAFYAVLGWPEI